MFISNNGIKSVCNNKHVTFIQYSVRNLPETATSHALTQGHDCDSTNPGQGGRKTFQKALKQPHHPVTLPLTCGVAFLHPRISNGTVGGRLTETWER